MTDGFRPARDTYTYTVETYKVAAVEVVGAVFAREGQVFFSSKGPHAFVPRDFNLKKEKKGSNSVK